MLREELPLALNNSLSQFLRKLAETLDISESHYKQAEERYHAIGNWLAREASVLFALSPEIYPQGSFLLGTVTKPHADSDDYDIDLVCEVRLTKQQVSQKRLKELVGVEIFSYADANSMNSLPEEGRRCWRLIYADGARFHMDILPAIPDGEAFSVLLREKSIHGVKTEQAIVITDNTLPNYSRLDLDWPRSNPRGYAEWFRERMIVQYEIRLKSLAESLKANIADIPEYRVKTPLQRAIQLMKRHRDIMFKDDPDDKPISIIITTLAAHAYANEGDLFEALINIVDRMSDFIEVKDGIEWVTNPVNPLENFADKWQEYPNRRDNFYKWLGRLQGQLDQIKQCDSLHECQYLLAELFGENVTTRVLKEMGVETTSPKFSELSVVPRSFFEVSHKKPMPWYFSSLYTVNITAVKKDGVVHGVMPKSLPNNGNPLYKGYSLEFTATTDAPTFDEIQWQVVNTGNEALNAGDPRGDFYPSFDRFRGGATRKETAKYRGSHWVQAFVIKNGMCIARSGEFVVNIM